MELIWIGLASLLAGLIILAALNLVLSEREGALHQWGFKIRFGLDSTGSNRFSTGHLGSFF